MPHEIYRRGENWHYRGTVAGRRLRGSCGTADKALAQRIAAEAEAKEWRRHLDGPTAHVTFAQAAIAYRQAGKPTRFLSRIEDELQNTPLREITTGKIKAMALKLYPKATGATRNRQAIVPAQAIINHAADLGYCSPIKVERFRVETKVKAPATLAWVESFAAHASPHLGALALFLFGTGARIGEAVALTWSTVDLAGRSVIINQSKTGSERKSHLPGPVVAALANIPSNRKADDLVFRYLAAGNVKQVWENAINRAGIARLTPHSLRHGFATTMLRAGYDVKTVAKLGGWRDAGTVLKHYAHAIDDPTLTDALFGTNLTHNKIGQPATNGNKKENRQ